MRKCFTPNIQLQTLLASIIGTSAMTLYSYMVSWGTNKNFKEPKLLSQLAYRLVNRDNNNTRLTGWGMHYLVGLLFAETYSPFWQERNSNKNIRTGLVLGGLSGFAAILLWKFTFDVHPNPPSIPFARFAGQLFIAHLIFGTATSIAFNIFSQLIRIE